MGTTSANLAGLWLQSGNWTSVHRFDPCPPIGLKQPLENNNNGSFLLSTFHILQSKLIRSLADHSPSGEGFLIQPGFVLALQREAHSGPLRSRVFSYLRPATWPFLSPCCGPTEARPWARGRGPLLALPKVKFLLIHPCFPRFSESVFFSSLQSGSAFMLSLCPGLPNSRSSPVSASMSHL